MSRFRILAMVLTSAIMVGCTSLAPVEYTNEGGFFRVDTGRNVFDSQAMREFGAGDEARAHCKKFGYSQYRMTKVTREGNYRHHYFECVNE